MTCFDFKGWRAVCPPFLFLLAAVALNGQSIRVLTEFQRVDPFGQVIAADRAADGKSREVLSPALARHTFSSFHIVVEPPPGTPYYLYIGLNPEDTVAATLYKEIFENRDGKWIPDKLEKVTLPYNGVVPEKHIPGQTVEVFLLDIFVPKNSQVRRMKIEPQMWIPDRWITYPMEARIVTPQLLTTVPSRGEIQPLTSPADTTYQKVFSSVFCGSTENKIASEPLTIRSLLLRNARQDAALALPLGKFYTGMLLGYGESVLDWCKGTLPGSSGGSPERVLRVRDRLLRDRP